jgi:hypothetical protein
MSQPKYRRSTLVALCGAAALFAVTNLSFAGAVTKWVPTLNTGSKGEGAAQAAITSLTGNPVTFTAACSSSSTEVAVLTWTSAGSGVTGYEVLVSGSPASGFSVDATQPSGTALTVNETYTSAGKKYYRLEAESTNWSFPGTTNTEITNAREASVSGTNGGFLTMATSGTECAATA